MKILLSPAKTLDFESELPNLTFTEPQFIEHTVKVQRELKKLKAPELQKLMHISADLAALNAQRNQSFSMTATAENSRPAAYAFDGDVYKGLDVYSLEVTKSQDLQDRVRILSGLYGMLRPLDKIQPYRLEMGAALAIGKASSLYEFWKKSLTDAFRNELQPDELIVNLASKEYSKVIDFKALDQTVVHPEFKDFKNGSFRIISFYAKRMRGVMARYLVEERQPDLDSIKSFEAEGYRFDATQTKDDLKPVFTR